MKPKPTFKLPPWWDPRRFNPDIWIVLLLCAAPIIYGAYQLIKGLL